MNTRAGTSTPSTNAATYAETLRELETLGVIFKDDETLGTLTTLSSLKTDMTPFVIKLLAMYDHEMLHRIMTAIRSTNEPARSIWRDTLGRILSRDITQRGQKIAVAELTRIIPQCERLLAINPIDAAIMNTGNYRDNSRAFQNLLRATYIEAETGIAPGDSNYNLVQATLIHISIMRPRKYAPDEVQSYFESNEDDIAYIAEHVDETLRLLPELYERKETSADAIATMLDVKPVLAEGAL